MTSGFFGTLYWVLKFSLPDGETNRAIVLVLIGALGHAFSQNVMGYYFGGSSDANASISDLTNKLGGSK